MTYLIVHFPAYVSKRESLVTPFCDLIIRIQSAEQASSPSDQSLYFMRNGITHHSAYADAENVFRTRSIEMEGAENLLSLDKLAV
jgi:hypothetical protein